jgi:hypothetical protein
MRPFSVAITKYLSLGTYEEKRFISLSEAESPRWVDPLVWPLLRVALAMVESIMAE